MAYKSLNVELVLDVIVIYVDRNRLLVKSKFVHWNCKHKSVTWREQVYF